MVGPQLTNPHSCCVFFFLVHYNHVGVNQEPSSIQALLLNIFIKRIRRLQLFIITPIMNVIIFLIKDCALTWVNIFVNLNFHFRVLWHGHAPEVRGKSKRFIEWQIRICSDVKLNFSSKIRVKRIFFNFKYIKLMVSV